jgi:hypothetical protein
MQKKSIMVCLAFVATAAFVSPSASAAVLTDSAGVAVPVGTEITWSNTGGVSFTGGFNLSCSTADFNFNVTVNNGAVVKGEIAAGAKFTGTASGGDCTSSLGDTAWRFSSKLCVETVTGTDFVKITGCGSNVIFTQEMTGAGICKYSTSSLTGTFLTNSDATVNLVSQEVKKSEG